MSRTTHFPRTARRYAWLRVLVVLLALLAAGAHTAAMADPPTLVSAETCGADCDVLDAALWPAATQTHRTVPPLRPGPAPSTRPSEPGRPAPAPVPAPHSPALHTLRTVVLRC